ncbi:MAG: hypothetical protein ACTSSO_07345 [Candidatus Hodarchaeales archaeon]
MSCIVCGEEHVIVYMGLSGAPSFCEKHDTLKKAEEYSIDYERQLEATGRIENNKKLQTA